MRCHQCGADVPALKTNCPSCGALTDQTGTVSLPAQSEESHADLTGEDRAAVEALPQGSALLIVQRGPQAGSRFLLDQASIRVGRHPESEIFLDDVTVSRRHATFTREQNSYLVTDVGSLNGTYVNRDRVDSYLLTNGDEVQIGKFRLIYFSAVTNS